MKMSNYPNGFNNGVLLRGLPGGAPNPRKNLYVGNNSTLLSGEKGASDNNDGSFLKPFNTTDYAIGQAKAGDVIYIRPGHIEDYDGTTTGFDADVAGITIVGLGHGGNKPRFDFNHATSKCIIGANDIAISNVVFLPSVTAIAIGLDVETGVTGVTLDNVEFAIGEDGAGTDEFIKAIHLTSGNHDTTFRDVKILAHASAAQATHGIHVDAASDRLTFDGVIIDGPYATNGILEDAAGVNHVVVDCSVDVTGTNYGFHASSTFAKRVNNLDGGELEDAEWNFIGRDDNNNVATTDNVVPNRDGSILERLEYIQKIGGMAYIGTVVSSADTTHFVSTDLAGFENSFFNTDWYLKVIYDAGGAAAAPEGEIVDITAYTSATGTFTMAATTQLAAGDIVMVIRRELLSTYSVAMPATPVANSLASFVASGGTALGTNLAASKSIVDALGFNGSAFVAGGLGMYLPRCVEKSDGAVLTGSDDLFTITGGPIRAKITGLVTTIIGGASNGKLQITTTTPAATVDLNVGAVAIDNDAAGTSYRNIGATSVFTPVTAGIVIIDPVTVEDCEFLLPIGTVKFNSTAAQTGVIKWYMSYVPLSPLSTVVAAA